MKQTSRLQIDQNGFASIVIALVLIIVLALLTVGFAQLARREQQNSLNKALADQAYYAAESGVNDTYRQLSTWLQTGVNPDPNICLGASGTSNAGISVAPSNTLGNGSNGVSYSCILVNMQPPTILWQDVSSDSDRSASFTTTGAINRLVISWGSSDSTKNTPVASGKSLLPLADWTTKNYPPVLEVSLTAVNPPFTRSNLQSNTATFYLYPSANGGSSVNFQNALAANAPIIGATNNCSAGGQFPCSATIDHINGGTTTYYLLHIINHYEQANIMVGDANTNNGGGAGTQRNFVDGQAQIDVTAKARNVLKRLQVRVPLSAGANLPPGAIEGQSTCKRFSVYSGFGSYDNLFPSCTLSP